MLEQRGSFTNKEDNSGQLNGSPHLKISSMISDDLNHSSRRSILKSVSPTFYRYNLENGDGRDPRKSVRFNLKANRFRSFNSFRSPKKNSNVRDSEGRRRSRREG